MNQLTTLITEYLEHCRTQKRLDSKTLKAYRIDLTQFSVFVKSSIVVAGVSLLAFEVYAFYIKSVARSFYSQLLLLWIPMRTKFPLCFLSAFFLMLFLIPFI